MEKTGPELQTQLSGENCKIASTREQGVCASQQASVPINSNLNPGNRKGRIQQGSEESGQVDDSSSSAPQVVPRSYYMNVIQASNLLPPADNLTGVASSTEIFNPAVSQTVEGEDAPNPRVTTAAYRKIILARDFNTWLTYYQRRNITPLSSDHLLTLMVFNVIRAHTINSKLLGLAPELMTDDDVLSPFNDSSSLTKQLPRFIPPSLQPTYIQKHVKHHPEADMFPFPCLRDNMILADGEYDDYDFCEDLMGVTCHVHGGDPSTDELQKTSMTMENSPPRTGPGLIVWSDPWRPGSWEMTESFARKWGWLFAGCKELVDSTNYWREKRGEERLIFEL